MEEEFDTAIPDEIAERMTTVQAAIDYLTANVPLDDVIIERAEVDE